MPPLQELNLWRSFMVGESVGTLEKPDLKNKQSTQPGACTVYPVLPRLNSEVARHRNIRLMEDGSRRV